VIGFLDEALPGRRQTASQIAAFSSQSCYSEKSRKHLTQTGSEASMEIPSRVDAVGAMRRAWETRVRSLGSARVGSLSVVAALVIGTFTGCGPRLDSSDPGERRAAVLRINDQARLAKLAVEHDDISVRLTAIEKLSDQAVLAKLAFYDKDFNVRLNAAQRLTDRALLTELAKHTKDGPVRLAAVRKLPGQTALAKLLAEARFDGPATRDARACVARMQLAAQEPRIQSRFPRLQCDYSIPGASETYFDSHNPQGYRPTITGENVTIKLIQDGKTLAQGSWSTRFPGSISGSGAFVPGSLPAVVTGEDLLKQLLRLSAFAQDDLAELVRSMIPEVRLGAVANLNDRAILAKVAIEDRQPGVRQAAEDRLTQLSR
jgi:hypothetical protein